MHITRLHALSAALRRRDGTLNMCAWNTCATCVARDCPELALLGFAYVDGEPEFDGRREGWALAAFFGLSMRKVIEIFGRKGYCNPLYVPPSLVADRIDAIIAAHELATAQVPLSPQVAEIVDQHRAELYEH